jgi:hypothetical protein
MSTANPDLSMLNSNLKDSPVSPYLQLKSVFKFHTRNIRPSFRVPRASARHALIYCLPGALTLAMIRGSDMVRRDWASERRRRHAREHIVGVVVDIGFGALEPSGAGLIPGLRFAGCRGFAA